MTDTLIKVLASSEVERITYAREFETEPFFATRAVMDIINEEPEWAWHRKEMIAIEMSVIRAADFEKRRRGIWRPMTMANPKNGARTVDMAFYSIQYNGKHSIQWQGWIFGGSGWGEVSRWICAPLSRGSLVGAAVNSDIGTLSKKASENSSMSTSQATEHQTDHRNIDIRFAGLRQAQ